MVRGDKKLVKQYRCGF